MRSVDVGADVARSAGIGGVAVQQQRSVACQDHHRLQHERVSESEAFHPDDILFRQPESSHLGDCPICFLPLPLDTKHSMMSSCCSKQICIGCYFARIRYEVKKKINIRSCPFCRRPEPKTEAEIVLNKMDRTRVNDPVAMQEAGKRCYHDGDYEGAFKYFKKTIEVADTKAEAHYCLSFLYRDGKGVDMDMTKMLYHLEEAAIHGHPKARHDLGVHEVGRKRFERGVKHFIIAASNGHDVSVRALRELHAAGNVSQADIVMTIRAYQAVSAATKSPQREAGALAMHAIRRRTALV